MMMIVPMDRRSGDKIMHEDFLRYMMVGLSRGMVPSPTQAGTRRRDFRGEDEQYFRDLAKVSAQEPSPLPTTTEQPRALASVYGRLAAGFRRRLAILQPSRRFHTC